MFQRSPFDALKHIVELICTAFDIIMANFYPNILIHKNCREDRTYLSSQYLHLLSWFGVSIGFFDIYGLSSP